MMCQVDNILRNLDKALFAAGDPFPAEKTDLV